MSEAEDTVIRARNEAIEAHKIMVAEKRKCNVSELEGRMDKFGAIHVRLKPQQNQEKKDAVSEKEG